MTRPALTLVALVLAAGAVARGQVLDRVTAAYGPHLDATDPLSLDLKLKSLSANPYVFWRGSKDLFYAWAKTNCADWLADRGSYTTIHGDLHVGNIGTYAVAPNRLAFGPVDFDDTATLPFQIELLQGLISLDLAAATSGIDLSPDQRAAIDSALLSAYRAALSSDQPAAELLAGEPAVAKLMKAADKPYAKEVDQYVAAGRFKTLLGKPAKPKEILRPLDAATLDAFAAGLARAVAADPALASQFAVTDDAALRQATVTGVLRTRFGSSGSQGQQKLLFLLRSPLKAPAGDVLLYLKEQIPTSAQRQGVATIEAGMTPAQRLVRDAQRLADPPPMLLGAVEFGGRSYALSLKEPWTDELDAADAKSADDLIALARIWGTVAGRAHAKDAAAITPRLTAALPAQLRDRAAAYVAHQAADYAAFTADPRLKESAARADAEVRRLAGE